MKSAWVLLAKEFVLLAEFVSTSVGYLLPLLCLLHL
jgi:hypothetical protein